VGGVGVAVYGDLTAERVVRVMGWSAEQSVADALRWSERRRGGFLEGDFRVIGGMARVLRGPAATGWRHRKRCPPAGGRCEEVTTVVMASRS
jgi:hypothetical protein